MFFSLHFLYEKYKEIYTVIIHLHKFINTIKKKKKKEAYNYFYFFFIGL